MQYLKKSLLSGIILIMSAFSTASYGHNENALPSYIPVSPTVNSLAVYADYPVSYYTGVPDISIPLYEIDIDGYKLPVSLSYHASGIKVAQEASWVGLGWALNAGGIITRTVKCYDDFNEYIYPGISVRSGYNEGVEVNDPTLSSLYTNIFDGTTIRKQLIVDSEPDIFSYSLPGVNGKFLLDKTRGAVLFNQTDNLKIEVLEDNSKKYFKVISPDGTVYVFTERETTSSYKRSGSMNMNNGSKYDESNLNLYDSPFVYTSSWYLSQIITVNKRNISFTYEHESYKGVTQESCLKYNPLSSTGMGICGPGGGVVYSCSKAVTEALRLSKITWDGGAIEFGCTSREDVVGNDGLPSPQKLSTLQVFDKNGNCIKNYRLDYDYFNNSYTGSYIHAFKRLKLNKLTNLLDAGNEYEFTYNEGTLPVKNSRNTDFWGYYNGSMQKGEYYCPAQYAGSSYNGGNKISNLTYMKLGSLASIRYPTGGITEFTYEANRYNPLPATVTQHVTQSLTVYQYYSDDFYEYLLEYGSQTIVVDKKKTFTIRGYAENMSCKSDPDVFYDDNRFCPFLVSKINSRGEKNPVYECYIPSELNGGCSHTYAVKQLTLSPGTYRFEASALAKDVWFSFSWEYDKEVTDTDPDKGVEGGGLRIAQIRTDSRTRNFSYPLGTLLIEPKVSYLTSFTCMNGTSSLGSSTYLVQTSDATIPMYTLKHGNAIGYNYVTESGEGSKTYVYHCQKESKEDDYPFMPTVIDYMNGMLSSIEYYKAGSATPIKTVNYNYASVSSQNIYGFMYAESSGEAHAYIYRVECPYITQETVTDYTANGKITTSKEYVYNDYLQLKKETVISGGEHFQTVTTYPTDQTDAVSRMMVARNLIDIPVESLSLKEGKVISGKRVQYKDTLGLLVPGIEHVLETNVPVSPANYEEKFVPLLSFGQYNAAGRPMEVTGRGVSVVYLWSYNGMYPVAELINCTYSQVEQQLGAAFIAALSGKTVPTDADMSRINALRTSFGDAHINTYTYAPLVGMTGNTNPQGLTTYYTYDAAGRLSESYILQSGLKRILEHYDYHYSTNN